MSLIRNILAAEIILSGMLIADASAAVMVNFENPTDLAENFVISINPTGAGNTAIPVSHGATLGVTGTGGLFAPGNAYDQYVILNSSFALAPGTTYTVGAHFRSRGYVGVGFADAGSYGSIDFQPSNSIMLSAGDETTMNVSSYSGGNAEWNNNDVLLNNISPVPDIQDGNWMTLNLSLVYNNLNIFDLSYSIVRHDENGNAVETVLDGSYSVINSGLSGNLYPFMFFQGGSNVTEGLVADNFYAVPEPSSTAVAMIGIAFGTAFIRRRKR